MSGKKKKKKAKGPRLPFTIPRPPLSHDIYAQTDELSKEWDVSQEKERLERQIRTLLLEEENIAVENALCLGLGSLEGADMSSIPFQGSRRKWNKSVHQLLVFETVLSCLRMCCLSSEWLSVNKQKEVNSRSMRFAFRIPSSRKKIANFFRSEDILSSAGTNHSQTMEKIPLWISSCEILYLARHFAICHVFP